MAGSHLSQKLRDRRRKIDLVDRKLLPLLNQRLRIAQEIGKVKKEMGKKIYDPKREKEILEKLSLRNRGPLDGDDLEKIFAAIMKVCRQSQR
jgi:chorismate mutase-like protein